MVINMRLIDADAIKLEKGFFEKINNVPKFFEWLGKQSTIDAVEVVRCKDCKHSEEALLPNQELWCNVKENYCILNWFCADGKKREEKDEIN